MKRQLYSESDIKIVLDQIRLYPDNLKNAFEESGKIIKRSPAAIAQRYQAKWKRREDFKAISVGSKNGFTYNVKNTIRKDGIFPEERKLNKPLWLIQTFLELSKEEQILIIKLITV